MCADAGLQLIITNPAARSHVGIAKEFLTLRASLAPGALRPHIIFRSLHNKKRTRQEILFLSEK